MQTAAFGYDGNGNLSSEATAEHSRSYVYDVENRLVSASGSGGNVELLYDPLGRLWRVTGPSGATQFLYDGDKLIAEYDGSGSTTPLRRYVHGPGTDEPVAVYEGAALGPADRRYLLPDERGSIAALIKDGLPPAINTYDEFGIPGTGNVGRFQYTGQTWIPELGLYYYKARFYSPKLGRFLQVDRIGYEGGINLYGYVGNDPVNSRDPTGLYECKTTAACDAATKGISEIIAARNFYRGSNAGSRIPRNISAARALDKTLSSLGTKGDGGVNIAVGSLPQGTPGPFERRSNTITLDTDKIRVWGRGIGEVLGHETQHYRQRHENLSPLAEEARPIFVEYLIGSAHGRIRGISGMDYVRGRLDSAYCHGSARLCNPALDRVMADEMYKPF